jgi:Xaa-Pro aminopeptidase
MISILRCSPEWRACGGALLLSIAMVPRVAGAQVVSAAYPPAKPFTYNYSEEAKAAAAMDLDHLGAAQRNAIYAARRKRIFEAMPDGAMLVFSVDENQPRHLDFQVPQSESHDLEFLTGLYGAESFDCALLLIPGKDGNREVLYTAGAPAVMKELTGIEDARPFEQLEKDLSVATTTYRDWRITEIRRFPIPVALARVWASGPKVLYVNYPRFPRIDMPEPPRLEFFAKLQRYSPSLQLRDSATVLDPVRSLHDAFDLACLRRSVHITGEGLVEGLRLAEKPGITELQLMEAIDFVYRYRGATLGFPTAVQETPLAPGRVLPRVPEGYTSMLAHSADAPIVMGGVVHVDTGASYLNHSADVQRVVPVGGHWTAEQRHLYELALQVQKAVIDQIKPGAKWWDLHNLAVKMLHDEGNFDQYYKYGIGHFVGMEVHDEGDYEQPLKPGMAMAIEQGIVLPGGLHMQLEDDVIVTETGHEWITQFIPIEPDDVEKMMQTPSSLTTFTTKPWPGNH